MLLLKSQVSVTVTHGVSVVGVAGWPAILTGWPVMVGVVSQPGAVVHVRLFTLHTGAGWAW